jgi:hypothetical protein
VISDFKDPYLNALDDECFVNEWDLEKMSALGDDFNDVIENLSIKGLISQIKKGNVVLYKITSAGAILLKTNNGFIHLRDTEKFESIKQSLDELLEVKNAVMDRYSAYKARLSIV